MHLTDQEICDLYDEARTARDNAYAPYSRYPVGAAVLTAGGRTYRACNVENASFGLTVCAERNALFAAVADQGRDLDVVALAVLDAHEGPCSPCGACRQVVAELAPDAVVFFLDSDGYRAVRPADLLPGGFTLPTGTA
jgi:cytidine deaminase